MKNRMAALASTEGVSMLMTHLLAKYSERLNLLGRSFQHQPETSSVYYSAPPNLE